MPTLVVGGTTIPYSVRKSARAKRIRITVRPGKVEVVAPRFTRRSTMIAFVESKRRWIYEKTRTRFPGRERELAAAPERFVSGAKVLFRGRRLRLHVTEVGVKTVDTKVDRYNADRSSGAAQSPNSLRFRNAFHVTVEEGLPKDQRERVVRSLVMGWLKERALTDAHGWVERYGAKLGVRPAKIRIGNQKTLWGSCSARGVVSLNWRLVAAPKPVYEYVVVHELCHLVERNHGPRFWQLVGELMPDYGERRAWLKKHGVALG